jgi:hypothetical protein
MVARRESRRRATRTNEADPPAIGEAPAWPGEPPPLPGRVAQSAAPTQAVYRPRAPESVVAERRTASSRAPQAPMDSAGAETRRRGRMRRRALLVVIAASVVLAAAIAALVVLFLTG